MPAAPVGRSRETLRPHPEGSRRSAPAPTVDEAAPQSRRARPAAVTLHHPGAGQPALGLGVRADRHRRRRFIASLRSSVES
ncbi:hypothetical protein PSMK_26310 [Phycisphaera mikurensis NBRC 102666]|uniref:Uncharacterized protein n=1 Tax=Phycisphaera mikurensis (strain NBRC 102666 / KCTC 22515 / FYK2301M01) TaxID=1142394 RepID=I0IHQ2_PHYMF|nr:hypothetical protein PSMK_26310 [Phycisphaera mikurensis NBRC 102666]